MNADLMGSAGFKLYFDQRMGGQSLVNSVVRHGGFAIGANRKPFAVTAMAADRKIDGASPGQGALNQRKILAMDAMVLKLFDQTLMGLDGPCHHQKSAGIFVDAMHDPGSWHLVERGIVMQQRILERPVMVPCRRVDDQTLRLVDHDQGLILVDDVERNGFRSDMRDHLKGRGQGDGLAPQNFSFGFRRLPVHADRAGLDPVLNPVTGIFWKKLA